MSSRALASLVVTPAVVAHRGASGYLPEHTLEAHRLGIRIGADDIELDLVSSADGVLVVRHDVELSATTDVAARPEFADRRTLRLIDGREQEGWFVDDFTFAELATLTARERFASLRAQSAAHDGRYGIASLDDVLAMVHAESVRGGRSVGVMLELKHPSYFAARGLSLVDPLLAELRRHGLDHPRSRVTVMAFETTVLREMARASRVAIIQLLAAEGAPVDLGMSGDPTTYAELATPAGLAQIDEYADGVGAHRDLVIHEGGVTTLVQDAHRQWLTVHVWTLRRENQFLPPRWRRNGPDGDLEGLALALLRAGVDGLITDHPDHALRAVHRHILAEPTPV